MAKVGAHVSAAGSLELAFDKALSIGADCTQIFISAPRLWGFNPIPPDVIEKYKLRQKETGIGPNFIHGTYLVSLGTSNPEHLQKSIDWLKFALKQAELLEIKGVIFHLGSHKGVGFEKVLGQVVNSLKEILDESETSSEILRSAQNDPSETSLFFQNDKEESQYRCQEKPLLLLEITAGSGDTLGSTFAEMGKILKGVNNDRLRITQHTFATGYDIKTAEGLKKTMEEFDREIGLQKLSAIHANDSKTLMGSHVDRHENIGKGFLGMEGFTNLINCLELQDVPFILEVPGEEGKGPDKENVMKLKSLVK